MRGQSLLSQNLRPGCSRRISWPNISCKASPGKASDQNRVARTGQYGTNATLSSCNLKIPTAPFVQAAAKLRGPRGTSCNGTETLRGMPFLTGRLKSKNQNYSKPKNHNYSKPKNQKYSKHKQELMAPSFSLFQACNPLRGRNDCGFCAWTYYQSQAR